MSLITDLHAKKVICRKCTRQKMPLELFVGQRSWHHIEPVCRHEEFYLCPECFRLDETGLLTSYSLCGCREAWRGHQDAIGTQIDPEKPVQT